MLDSHASLHGADVQVGVNIALLLQDVHGVAVVGNRSMHGGDDAKPAGGFQMIDDVNLAVDQGLGNACQVIRPGKVLPEGIIDGEFCTQHGPYSGKGAGDENQRRLAPRCGLIFDRGL